MITKIKPYVRFWMQNGRGKVWKSEDFHYAVRHTKVFKDAEPDFEIRYNKFRMTDLWWRTKN